MKISVDWEKAKLSGAAGIVILTVIIGASVGLGMWLLNNPHRELHKQIFDTADKVRNYYRDRPGYWHLSTESAKQNGLIAETLLSYTDYDVQVGQGADGDMSLPSDMSFDITLKNLNKSACISLCELKISKQQQLALIKITLKNPLKEVEFSWGGEHPLPIEKYSARDLCAAQNNVIIWTFQ